MSSIIDELLFNRLRQPLQTRDQVSRESQENLEELCKKIYLNSSSVLFTTTDEHHYELINRQSINNKDYVIRMRLNKEGKSLRVEARLLKNSYFERIGSRHTEILLLKQIANLQCATAMQSTLYVHLSTVVMSQEVGMYLGEGIPRSKLAEFCTSVINRNLQQFNHFLGQHWDRCGNIIVGEAQEERNSKDLLISQILNTTTTTFGAQEENTQFKETEKSLQKKRDQIKNMRKNIVPENELESLTRLFLNVTDFATTSWVRDNFEHTYASSQKRFGSLLAVAKFKGTKRIDDYIFNTVKVHIKETMPKPVNEGGSCFIYLAKAVVTFISSLDSTAYQHTEDKKERVIAIKKLKPEFEKKFAHKLEHEKNIVSTLKGGCSYFIPKYLRAEATLDKPDTLMMEFIQGDELDFYIMTRVETISLWTKVCILLNLVHGLRYLQNYGIVHLDVKPINALVCKQLMVKIIDYGEAYHKKVCKSDYSPGYTFPYVAPEVFAHFAMEQQRKPALEYSEKQDVFALGMIMAEVIFNSKVFNLGTSKFREVYSNRQILQRYFVSPEKLEGFGERMVMSTLCHITMKCLEIDPQKRPKLDWIAVSLKLLLSSSAN